MTMRLKSTLLIILIIFVSTAVNFFSGIYFTHQSLTKTMEQDLSFAIGIADSLVGTKMDLLKTEAATVSARLASAGPNEEMTALMAEQFDIYPEISALSVFDRNGIIASYSVPLHNHDLAVGSEQIEMVYAGGTIISSPFYCSVHGDFVMNVYTPMGPGKILAMTIPGRTFTDILSQHRLWQTGDMFMLNEEGTFVGAADEAIVRAMDNYIEHSSMDPDSEEIGNLIRKILSLDHGVDRYRFKGVEHLCAYSRIYNSLMGWRVAVTVPLRESPQADALNGQIYTAMVFLLLGVFAAFFLSMITARPFKKIETQNRDLEDLNKTILAQANAIREEHVRIQLMLDATPLACRMWSRDFTLIECNEAAVKLFNMKDKQEYMDRYFDLSPEYQPDGQTTREKIRQSVGEAFETGMCTYDWMYNMLDGTPVPAEVTMVRVPYGEEYAVAAYSRDLREQKKMMSAIEHRDNLLNTGHRVSFSLFNTAEDRDIGVVLRESMEMLGQCVGADQVYIAQNEMMDEMLYFTCKYAWAGDLYGEKTAFAPGMRFPYGLDPDWDKRFLQGQCLNGPTQSFPAAIQKFFAAFGIKTALIIPILVHEQFWGIVGFSDCEQERVFAEDEVGVLRSMGLMMATAVNRNAQAAVIREAHHRIRILTNATPLGFNLWDRNLRNMETNDTAVKLFGLQDQKEYLERFFELSPQYQPDGSSSREQTAEILSAVFAEGYAQFEWMHQTPDGVPIPAEITLVRLAYGGDYVVAGYIRDLREHKKVMAEKLRLQGELETALKDAQAANHAKSSFLASMSHEIRTPLNAVIGLSELMLGGENLAGDVAVNLEKICNAGSTILSIVNNILDISKIESGKFELNPVRYDTPSLINDIVTLNIVRIGEKPVKFNLDVDPALPGVLYGDDLRVKQIFNNLLSNAFKYTNSGTVEWRLSFKKDHSDILIFSSIRDTGIGIKPEDVQRLFSDYNQVDMTTNRKIGGTGLGLAITKRLVEMMDGSITVESEYGKGSTFNLILRQALVSDTPIGQTVADNIMGFRYTVSKRDKLVKRTRINLSYAHVLIVDDIMTNLDVAKGMLNQYEIKVDCATSGRQAIEMIRAETPRYNAVFMDHMMPGMDGIEATRIIREDIGTDYARNIPIIALTANAIVGNEEMFLLNGFQAFISKPIDAEKLDSVLRRWVRDKNLEKEPAGATENALLPDAETRTAVNENSLLDKITISGVDKEKALERFGGNEMVFIDVLRSYSANTRSLLNNLRLYLAAENFEDYSIVIHGIKGSSYGICAKKTGKAAELVELAAKTGNFDAVKTRHIAFVQIAEALLDSIDKAVAEIGAVKSRPVAPEPDRDLLREVREACKTFDMDRVDKVMAQLESFQYEKGGKTVAWLRAQIDDMNFERIFDGEWPSAEVQGN